MNGQYFSNNLTLNQQDFQSSLNEENITQFDSKRQHNVQCKLYKYRYVIVSIFALSYLVNSIQNVVFSPISVQVSLIYNTSYFFVAFSGLIGILIYVLINFPSNYFLDQRGLYQGILIGGVISVIGSCLRIMINTSFWFHIFGQFILGISAPFFTNAIAKISMNWFPSSKRTVITSFLSIMNILGIGVGFLIPSFFVFDVGNSNSLSPQQISQGKQDILKLLATEATLNIAIIIPLLILFRSKPKSSPSIASLNQATVEFLKGITQCLKNKTFILMNFCQLIVQGNFTCLANVLQFIITPFNFNANNASIMGLTIVISGLIGAIFFGMIIDKTKKFKYSIIICIFGHIVSLTIFIFILPLQKMSLVVLASIVMGLFTALIPICIEFGCELLYPVGEAMITGIIMSLGNLMGIIESVLYTNFVNDKTKKRNNIWLIILIILSSIAFGVSFFQQEKLKRLQFENQQQNSEINSIEAEIR